MKIEWLYEAQCEFRDFLTYYQTQVGKKHARKFADQILDAVGKLESFPELGVLGKDTLMGKYGFWALFINQYVCVYKIEDDLVLIYHLADARKNIYTIYSVWNE